MHTQHLRSFALVVFASSTVLAAEVTTIFLPEMYSDSLTGKVIGSDGPLTTYVIDCLPWPQGGFYPIGACDVASQGWTLTSGPSTMRVTFDYPDNTMIEACSLHSSTSLVCDMTMPHGSSTEVESGGTVGPASDCYQTVTITGTEIASASASAQTSPTAVRATATTTGSTSATAAASEKADEPEKAAANTASSMASSTAAASQSTNAARAMGTGNAKWAVGGAAAMAAIAMA
ncbi:hypothetical protein BDV26DRAFT_267933 [Aspergillus bertholletiae]|uniref:GPI anchored protein n=1 Tax=Aspergillus bertholletiae TaxID=1226010 RepID=A0A5N7B073_9EURO|nr:hypothetical protein BDV26DRAFT_267933 [Aspergillus bertholletiae]